MSKLLIALMLLCKTAAFADWLPAAQLIPEGSSTFVNYDVYTTYNAANQTVVATWSESDDEFAPIFYAVYDGSTWTTAGTNIPLGTSSGAYHNVIPAYDPANQTVVAVWNDVVSFLPYYAVFDGTTWITPGTVIPPGTSTGAYNDVSITYDPVSQMMIAAWSDATNQFPYYSVFNGITWTTTAVIPIGSSTGAQYDVTLTYDAVHQTIIAAWADRLSQIPYYAIYDGAIWTTPGTPIPLGTSTGVNYNVTSVFNAFNGTVIAAWGDAGDTTPYYAVFNGTTWVPARVIPQGASAGVYQSISLTYNSDTQQVFAAWSDNSDYVPFYSILNEATWTTAALVPVTPSLGIDYDIILVFDPAAHQIVATWANYPGEADPYFNIFVAQLPAHLVGTGCCVHFTTQKAWVNHLTWSASPGVIAYNIYRNEVFIAQVSGDTLEYNDVGSRVGIDVYLVTAVFANGVESLPQAVVIPAHKSCR